MTRIPLTTTGQRRCTDPTSAARRAGASREENDGRQIVEPPGSHEPTEHAKTPKKAAASGWIGSALEYYDFFIYAQAAALVFPTLFFPAATRRPRIVAVVRDLRRRLRRPADRRLRPRPLGRHPRPQERARPLHVADRRLDLPGGVPARPTRRSASWAPILLVVLRLVQGFAVGGEISGASAMILEHSPFGRRGYFAQLHPAGRAGRPDPRRRDLPAAVRASCRRRPSSPGAGASRSCSAPSWSSPAT